MILLSSSPNLPLTLNPSKTSDKVECRLPQEQYHACNRFRSQMKDSNQEFANSNTCCPGVEDQWQGRAPSDILTSESKQLNRGTTLMYMSVISCWMHSIDCGNAATTLKITQSSAKKERTLARFGLACSNFVETECLIVVQVILFKNRLWLFN